MEEKFKCPYCKEVFPSRIKMLGHQDEKHEIFLLPIQKEELLKLVRYIQSSNVFDPNVKKSDLVSPELFERMKKLLLKSKQLS